jgi:hypothetical protein
MAGELDRSVAPRVVHLVPALFGSDRTVGGAERYALELARHMAEIVPTTLLSFGESERRETAGALRIRVLGDPWYVRGQRFNALKWSMFTELRAADVIHCHQQHIMASSLTAVFGRLSRRRVFVSDLTTAAIGWLTSWEIEAVSSPRVITRLTWASSACAFCNASSAHRQATVAQQRRRPHRAAARAPSSSAQVYEANCLPECMAGTTRASRKNSAPRIWQSDDAGAFRGSPMVVGRFMQRLKDGQSTVS